jgi:hypothetical protein
MRFQRTRSRLCSHNIDGENQEEAGATRTFGFQETIKGHDWPEV